LTQFVAAKKSAKSVQEGHQELGRFVAWCGRERNVCELSPSEVADYAQQIGLGGPESAHRLSPVKAFLTFWKDQGWIENGLASHLRIPRGRRNGVARGSAPRASRPVENGKTHLSQQGYDRLVAQLDDLKNDRVGVVEEIRRAMADKDFRENAPLDAAKERQGIIESRIRELEASIANSQILPEGQAVPVARSAVGAKVTLKDLTSGRVIYYTLVDVREADAASGRISTESPVGLALLDRTVGEEVTINVPRGVLKYIVEDIARA
jgi:transcription elongation factor GreA